MSPQRMTNYLKSFDLGATNGYISIVYNDANFDIVENYFATHPKIRYLDLVGRYTEKVPEKLYCLDSLKHLDFILDKKPANFPANFSKIRQLDTLLLRLIEESQLPIEITKLGSLKVLDISASGVTTLPEAVENMKQLQDLNIEGTKITSLPSGLNQLKNLKKLNVSDCNIAFNSFTNIDSLEQLKLDKYKWWSNFVGRLTTHSKLKSISLRENSISSFPSNLRSIEGLTNIDLGENSLDRQNLDFSMFHYLKNLNLELNSIDSNSVLGLKFASNSILEELMLSFNKLNTIPSEVLKLGNLKRLSLSDNNITLLPDDIRRLKKLTYLNLNKNNLTEIVSAISELNLLDSIDLGANFKLADISAICHLDSLRYLVLDVCELPILPGAISNLSRLDELHLGYNSLESLPEEMKQMKRLKILKLRENKFSKLPFCIGEMDSLQDLDIGSNKLKDISFQWEKLKMLSNLDLEDNAIRKLPSNFGSLLSLKQLTLSKNKLDSSDADLKVVANLKNLKSLNVANCGLKQLPSEISSLDNLTRLDISGNPIGDASGVTGRMKNITDLSDTNTSVAANSSPISIFFRILAFVTGLFLIIVSTFLYKSEQGKIENRMTDFWIFMSADHSEAKGFKFYIYSFISTMKGMFERLIVFKFWSLQTLGVLLSFNCAFLCFYSLYNFIFSYENNFLDPRYLFVIAFLTLGFMPVINRKLNSYILPTAIILILLFIYIDAITMSIRRDGTDILPHVTSELLISSFLLPGGILLSYFYFKLLYWAYFKTRRTILKSTSLLILQLLVAYFVVRGIYVLPMLMYFVHGIFFIVLFYFMLSLNVVFTTSLIAILFYAILLINQLFERSSYFIIEQKIITNRKVAIPIALLLLTGSSFLADPIVAVIRKLLGSGGE